MPRSFWSTASVLGVGLWFAGAVSRPAVAADDFAFYHEEVLGTSLELRVRADDAEAARRAEECVLREIDRLGAIFSGYDPASEFSRWQTASQGPTRISQELFEILRACDHWQALSGGAFDPRAEALSRLWSRCAGQGRTPTAGERAGAIALMSRPAWRLDPVSRTAERLSDCPLSLNAIAKGEIIERACAAAMEGGRRVRGLVLNIGGDLRVVGDTPRTIAIARPQAGSEAMEPLAYIEVRDRAVATSGRHLRGTEINGRWYSHIIDPRSGLPADATACATVIAERSADADALATAFNVLAPEEGVRLANALPGVECLIVSADGRVARSDGWDQYERARPAPLPFAFADGPANANANEAGPKASPSASWGDDFEMLVTFEINRPKAEGGGYRRPYVAVWVEDKDGFPVRNLLLWVSLGGAGPWQWLPEMTRWHRSDLVRKRVDKRDMVLTISQPTRPPGTYSVLWDGKDDRGKPLARGEYTICIDAAREHGTYQDMRAKVTLGDEPFTEELKGGVELKSASIAYRRKAPAK